jgi:hypothetical protein
MTKSDNPYRNLRNHIAYDIEQQLTNAFIVNPNNHVVLPPNIPMISENGIYSFIFLDDGNLVIYDRDYANPIWNSNTHEIFPKPNKCIFQSDGNILLTCYNTPVWAAPNRIFDATRAPYTYIMQNDGNFVIYDRHAIPVWTTASGN